MASLSVTGLPEYQKRALMKYLKGKDGCTFPDADLHIRFVDDISLKRRDCLWYGGAVAEMSYKGYVFSLDAIGDIYAELTNVKGNRRIVYVKDKSNNGNFGSEILGYIKTDRALQKVQECEHHKYRLQLEHNNWWECSVTDPSGKWHDLMWAACDDDLFSGISEVIGNMDETISYLVESDKEEKAGGVAV